MFDRLWQKCTWTVGTREFQVLFSLVLIILGSYKFAYSRFGEVWGFFVYFIFIYVSFPFPTHPPHLFISAENKEATSLLFLYSLLSVAY
jgi:hypothetical protein